VKIPGIEQMNKSGAFLVTDWTKRENIYFDSTCFRGTMVSRNGYKHTRDIQQTKTGYMIVDDVFGDGDYCDFKFRSPCDVKIDSQGFLLLDKGEPICRVITNGSVKVNKAYRSLYYLKKDEINCVTVRESITDKKCKMKFIIELLG